jgi:hypothetical protein
MSSDDIIEISELGTDDFNIDFDISEPPKKGGVNFGGGIELLMNDKKKETGRSKNSDIDVDDLNNLEAELNDLAEDIDKPRINKKSSLFDIKFGDSKKKSNDDDGYGDDDEPINIRFSESPIPDIGKATASSSANKTWDGFTKFNNIPINPDKAPAATQPQMSKEELLREKFKFLRKLETLESKGVNLTKKYTMDSPLAEMQGEYEMIMEEKNKQNSVKFSGNMLMACINGIEFLNNRFDPFDIKLDGWSDQVNENLEDYDEVFGELYEKYKSKASMAPELKLLFQLGGSAAMIHMTNTLFKSAMPSMDDVFRQNPDLMRQFQSAAVNTMGQTNPGLSGFMSGVMNQDPLPRRNMGMPPPPLATQNHDPPNYRPGNNNLAPNIGGAFTSSQDDGINIRESFGNTKSAATDRTQRPTPVRPEMKGPSDLNDILSGLKTKTINIEEDKPNTQSMTSNSQPSFGSLNDNSTISISELKELQGDGNMPKRSKRRQKSDKNTVSLNI